MPINDRYNFDDIYFRDLTVCLLSNLENKIKWTNVFESGSKDVGCKIYYSLTGNEDYLMDSFVDDIASEERKVELNTDMYPRGHVTLNGMRIKSEEFANPNVWLRMVVENHEEIKNVLSKVRALPIMVNYELSILVNSEIDIFKASQSIMNTLWMFKYMYFEYNFMNIDAVLVVPDENQIEIQREHNLGTTDEKKLTISFEVHSYYPAFNQNTTNNDTGSSANGATWYNQIRSVKKGKVPEFFNVELFPRVPNFDTDDEVELKLDLNSPGDITVKIFDHMARVIDTMEFGERFDEGKVNLTLDISDKDKYKTGIYYIKVEVDSEQETVHMKIDR